MKLAQFLEALPRLDGAPASLQKFACRFRVADPICGYVWQDVRDAQATLPQFEDMVCAKLLRLDSLARPVRSRLRRKPITQASAACYSRKGAFSGSGSNHSQQQQQQQFDSSGPSASRTRSESPPPQSSSSSSHRTSVGSAKPVRRNSSTPKSARSATAAAAAASADSHGDLLGECVRKRSQIRVALFSVRAPSHSTP